MTLLSPYFSPQAGKDAGLLGRENALRDRGRVKGHVYVNGNGRDLALLRQRPNQLGVSLKEDELALAAESVGEIRLS